MHIHCLGLNHQTADIGLRERLAFSEEGVKIALSRLGCGSSAGLATITEMVILSTCNRVEIYAVESALNFEPLVEFLAEVSNVPTGEFTSHLYRLSDEDTVDHLFRVAGGLDSLVLGEPQILGQVMNAFELARGQATVGPILSRLFHKALHMGKRARSESSISQNPASVSSVAAHFAERVVNDLPNAEVAILGAGEMAELAVEALRKRGAEKIVVLNRTLDRAQKLANRWNGKALTFERLPEVLSQADIMITSTSAPHILIHKELVKNILPTRYGRPLVFIDIAVPRDVDQEVNQLEGVYLYDIDTLNIQLEDSLARRAKEVPRVEQILKEEKKDFMQYLNALDVLPLITAMRQQAEEIRQAELEKTLRRLPNLTAEEQKRLDALTQALVKKILHEPTSRLRAQANGPLAAEYAAAASSLFGLERHSSQRSPRVRR